MFFLPSSTISTVSATSTQPHSILQLSITSYRAMVFETNPQLRPAVPQITTLCTPSHTCQARCPPSGPQRDKKYPLCITPPKTKSVARTLSSCGRAHHGIGVIEAADTCIGVSGAFARLLWDAQRAMGSPNTFKMGLDHVLTVTATMLQPVSFEYICVHICAHRHRPIP